ncbi:MAG: L-ascorbate 6-phosphate lactonase [Verrucomicrobia bacterium]|nr:L-ascorbate 6-phosphate lactonase [Verrucomicrobiota bacterium]
MKKTFPTKLSRSLAALRVPSGSVALGWLGQAGFVLKSPQGCCLALDPYLSNSCEAVGKAAGLNLRRMLPTALRPQELVGFDGILFTHSHQDHVDPETVVPYLRAGGAGALVAPHEAAARLVNLGADAGRITLMWPNRAHRIGDFTLRATFAIPFGGDDLTHIGYLVEVRGGPRIYFTGDTDYNEILSLSVAPFQPDVMVSVINPAFRNLSPREAARLAKAIGPRWVVPCHHDLFPDNSLPDRLFRTNLVLEGIADMFCPVEYGKMRLFRKDPRRRTRLQPLMPETVSEKPKR